MTCIYIAYYNFLHPTRICCRKYKNISYLFPPLYFPASIRYTLKKPKAVLLREHIVRTLLQEVTQYVSYVGKNMEG